MLEKLQNNSGKILFIVVSLFIIFLGYNLYQAPVEGLEEKFVYLLKTYGYIILFAWSILEGEAGLIMAGLLSHTGDMNLYIAIFVAGLGGFAGDQIYFYIGRFNKSYVYKKFSGQRRKFALAHLLLTKYGWPIIFAQRYMYGMRTIIPISIGLTRYSAKMFAFINLISAWFWAALTIVPAWYFGEEILVVLSWVKEHWYFAAPFGILIGGSILYYFHKVTKKRRKTLKVNLVENSFLKVESEIEIYIVDDIENTKDKELLEILGFEEKDESVILLPEVGRIYVGCEDTDYDSLAIAISCAIKKFQGTKFKSAKIELGEYNLKALVEGTILGAYKFDEYKSDKKKPKKQELNIVVSQINKEIEKIFEDSKIIAKAVNKTRDIVNSAPADFYPEIMAETAKKIAKESELECKIEGEKYLEKNAMNAMLSVGRASIHESKLIHLTYKPENAKKKVVLVGKGLTYDSGGLSLKPADYMVTMKSDKSGGSAVLGIMSAVAKLGLEVEVHGIIGAVENMIGGDAYKPDDILVAKNGKTIEVRNTDAEGRLVLADCLCYAQDEIDDIDYIFDYATLTGACVVGVGEYTSGIMGRNDSLKKEIVENALEAGEYATSLDFNRFLRKTIKSEIADISNIANTRYGGAITAGIFLDNFIYEENKEKWIHHDIAGPAYVEKAWGYNPFGASGAGVRMTLEFLKNIN